MRFVFKLFLFALFFVGVWHLDQYLQVLVASEQSRLAVDQFGKPDPAARWGLLVQNFYWVRFVLWTTTAFIGVVGFWPEMTYLVRTARGDNNKEV